MRILWNQLISLCTQQLQNPLVLTFHKSLIAMCCCSRQPVVDISMSEPCQLFLVLPLQFCPATLTPCFTLQKIDLFPISPKISCPFSGQKHCQNLNQTMLIYTALFHLDKVQGFLIPSSRRPHFDNRHFRLIPKNSRVCLGFL